MKFLVAALWILGLGAFLFYGLLSFFLPKKLREQAISKRPSLTLDEIYAASFRQLQYPRNLVERVWNELAQDLALDPNKIRPADRFDVELSVRAFPLGEELNERAFERLNARLRTLKASRREMRESRSIKTLYDYVAFTCRIESHGVSGGNRG